MTVTVSLRISLTDTGKDNDTTTEIDTVIVDIVNGA